MKSPIFTKEKLLYFPQKSGIVPIFRKSPSSYISYFCEHTPWPRHENKTCSACQEWLNETLKECESEKEWDSERESGWEWE